MQNNRLRPNRWKNHSIRPLLVLIKLLFILTLRSKLTNGYTAWMDPRLKTREIFWCMGLISSQLYPSTPKTKNTRILFLSTRADSLPMRIALWGRGLSLSSTVTRCQLAIIDRFSWRKLSNLSQPCFVKTRKKKETRRKKLEFREAGFLKRIRLYLFQWVGRLSSSKKWESPKTISRPVWTWMWECKVFSLLESLTTISGTWGV